MGLAKTIIDCKIERKQLKKICASYHNLHKVKHSTSFLITIAFMSQIIMVSGEEKKLEKLQRNGRLLEKSESTS